MSNPLLQYLRRVARPPADTTDADLLHLFTSRHDEGAFTALVHRHGPMVMGVCERLVGHHDAEDAFQATFLVLARKARSITRPELLGNWLYGVAYRTALKARSRNAERRRKEGQAMTPAAEDPTADVAWADLRPVLDEEVSRLPDRFRVPFVLCYLQGKTNEEAARVLGCPQGTILSRLATARERLRSRLTRRGLMLSTGLLAAALCVERTSAAVPPALVGPTVKAALGVAAGQVAGLVSAEAAALMKGTLRAMLLSKLKVVALASLAVAVVGGVLLTHRSDGGEPVNKVPPAEAHGKAKPPKDEEAIQGTWKLVRLDQVGHEPTKDEKAAWEAGALKAVITADKIVYPDKSEATYKLDPTTTPKRIELTVKSDRKMVTVTGIYTLDGDELRLCIGREGDTKPPASFDVKKARRGEFPTSWTFKRDKPAPAGDKGGAKKPEDAAAKELKAMEGKGLSIRNRWACKESCVRSAGWVRFSIFLPYGDSLMDEALKLQAEQLAGDIAAQAQTLDDLNGLMRALMKSALERMLDTELDAHLGRKAAALPHDDSASSGQLAPANRRNGHSQKTVRGELGEITLDTPRDRNGTFVPQLIAKHQRRLAGFDEKVLALYAKGMTTRDIQDVVKELYGVDVRRPSSPRSPPTSTPR